MSGETQACALLAALWEVLDGGFVELRPLYPERPERGSPAWHKQRDTRRWLPLSEALDRMPGYLGWCDQTGLSAFYGVLPRRVFGGGSAKDVAPGAAAWVDLDVAPREARERLAVVPFRPSAVVLTGRGVHAYWFLSEAEPPEVCAGLSKRLAAVTEADPAAVDPPRLLRLPGARNPKYPHAGAARLVQLDRRGRYHAADIDDWLPDGPKSAPKLGPPVAVRPEQVGLALRGRARRGEGFIRHRADAIARTCEGGGKGSTGTGRNSRLYAAGRLAARLAAAGAADLTWARRVLVEAGTGAGLGVAEATQAVENGIRREAILGGGRPRPFDFEEMGPRRVRVGGAS